MGLIMAVGVSLYYSQLVPSFIKYVNFSKYVKRILHKLSVDIPVKVNINELIYEEYVQFNYLFKLIIITLLILAAIIIYKKVFKKKMSAIKIIIVGAILGILLGGFGEKTLEYLSKLAKY